ncbi:MAG: tyrosine-type recombinase/integrase [Halioglobus sp.]
MAGSDSINFTQAALNALPVSEKRAYFYDTKVPQLGVTIHPTGKKTFHIRATVKGRTKRVTIPNGRYPGMKIEQARRKGLDLLHTVAEGNDPVKDKRDERAAEKLTALTVEQAVDLFAKNKIRRLSTGEKLPLKDSTVASYRHSIKKLLGEERYQGPLVNVDEDTLTKRVHSREKKAKTATATGLRSLSAVWNWLGKQKEYRDQLPANPVKEYSRYNEGLHIAAPKQGRIEREELPAWFEAVESLPAEYADFFLWLIFTGTRYSEAKGLQWQDIDWRGRTYRLRDPKNRRDATLPLPSYIGDRLKKRKQDEGPVFAFEADARNQRKVVIEQLGKHFTNHDLRRTFSGVAQAVCSYTSVKRLMNHAFTDITEQYIGHSADLGEEIDKVQREILRLAGKPTESVVAMRVVS